jgi:hypothetical protein
MTQVRRVVESLAHLGNSLHQQTNEPRVRNSETVLPAFFATSRVARTFCFLTH